MSLGQGLTVWALIALFGNLGHLALGWRRDFVLFNHLEMFAYVGSLLFWMIAFWRPERRRAPLSDEMRTYLMRLHQHVQNDLERINSTEGSPR